MSVETSVKNISGKEVRKQPLSDVVFAEKERRDLLHQVVRWQRASWRSGTHSTQTRAEMTGGGAKPWKQKGTGRARAGSNTSPLWVGGGIAHGPKPRKYDFALNKKERELALRSALSARLSEGRLIICDGFDFPEVKTKLAAKALAAIGVPKGEGALIVLDELKDTAVKSLRNLPGVKIIAAKGVNVYDVLAAKYLVLTPGSVQIVEERLV